jgi:hypothetical protein
VIREARNRSGYAGPNTASLPVVPNFPPPDGNDFYNNGNDFYNGEPAWSPEPGPRRRTLVLAGAGLAACGIIALIVLLLTSSTTPAATITGKTLPSKSPSQSVGQDGQPTTASLPPSTVGGYWTGTNLGKGSKTPTATPSASPTTSERQSSKPTSSPTTSKSPSAPASTSSAPTGTPTDTGSASPTTSSTSTILPTGLSVGDGTGG